VGEVEWRAPSRAGTRPAVPPGRLRRFVQMYGWRAYAIPVLVVATFVTLLDAASVDSAAEGPAAVDQQPIPPRAPTSAVVTTTPAPVPSPTAGGEPVNPSATFTADAALPTFVQRGEGTLSVVPGESGVLGAGPLLRFRVEVEDGIAVDAAAFARAVEETLGDPRSWGAGGRQSFQRVASGSFDFRVALVSPDNVNSFCPGLDTRGYTSCRSGDRAVINLVRWETAVPDYEGDIPTYRHYVVNHEVGHALGNGHESCPGPGELAPVMQQQTFGLEGCVKNAWPYP